MRGGRGRRDGVREEVEGRERGGRWKESERDGVREEGRRGRKDGGREGGGRVRGME